MAINKSYHDIMDIVDSQLIQTDKLCRFYQQ